MLNFLGNITSAIVKTAVALPVAVVADVVTLGGTLNNSKPFGGSYTGDTLESIVSDLEDSLD